MVEAMSSNQRFQVLAQFRPFIQQIMIFNFENYTTNDKSLLRRNIVRAAMMCILFTGLLVTFSINCRLCSLRETEWSKRAYHFASAMGLIQQFVIYAVMSSKNRQIAGVIEQLQTIINARKLSWIMNRACTNC